MSQTDTNMASAINSAKAGKGKGKAAPAQGKAPVRIPARPMQGVRTVISLVTAQRICATEGMAAKMTTLYGLHQVDYHGIREATEEHLIRAAQALEGNMVNSDGTPNERALEIHMQRIVDAYVRSAHGAGEFFDKKAAEARIKSSAVANADRDEDRQGIDGLENLAQRACSFAAQLGLQSYAILAAAHGAVDAYAHVCGKDWKPYEGTGGNVSTQAIAIQASAFNRD